MLPPEPSTSVCCRCGTRVEPGAGEGAVCELCAKLIAQENLATVEVEVPESWQTTPPSVAATPQFEVIGDYEILGKLGQGGMGAVYRARQISLDRVVALKILPSQLEEDEHYVARFQREAAVAAGVNHPNLVQVYASGVADGCHFIAMELVEGENLRQRLKRGDVPMAEAMRLCLEVARGLQFAWHRAQLIHRDIKPGNIFLAGGGTVKVGDLGLAKSLLSTTTGITHTGTAIGTPHYISPEQARGDKSIDLRADIYSLGCTLYELLTGATPYQGTDPLSVMSMHLNSPPPAIMKVMPQCPMPVGRLVNRMLRKSRHERHQTYEELIAAMEAAQQQLGQGPSAAGPSAVVAAWKEIGAAEQQGGVVRVAKQTPPPGSAPAPAASRPRPRRLALSLGLATLAIAGVSGWVWSGVKPRPATVGAGATTPAPFHGSPAAATPATATQDAPFTNSLGMKFVPVPITGGPTGGQRVLFSIWETRVQDYEAFATGTTRAWSVAAGDRKSLTFPAWNVSGADAEAFCAWLTGREQRAGKIGPGERYRLPASHEWSCAVGMGDREDPRLPPMAKNGKLPDLFPWGTAWPPPPGAGNYRGAETTGFSTDGQSPLAGYRDAFRGLGPVGTFAANAFGLFDLGGNVSEVCGDAADESGSLSLRGGSYLDAHRESLLSSALSQRPRDHLDKNSGFRVVLAPASAFR